MPGKSEDEDDDENEDDEPHLRHRYRRLRFRRLPAGYDCQTAGSLGPPARARQPSALCDWRILHPAGESTLRRTGAPVRTAAAAAVDQMGKLAKGLSRHRLRTKAGVYLLSSHFRRALGREARAPQPA